MAPNMSLPTETQRTLNSQNPRWRIEFATRLLTAFFSFISIVIFGTTVHQSKAEYGGGDWTDGFPIGPLLIALLFNPIIILLTFFLRHGRPAHPAWSLTADLFIWGLGVPAIIFSVGDGWFWYWQPVYFVLDDGLVPCIRMNWGSKECNPLIYKLGRQEIAANVFLALVLIIHFVLFVRACIATHQWRMRNKQEKARRRNIELQYHRSPEEHQREAPPPPYIADSTKRESAAGPISPISTLGSDDTAVKYA